MIKNYFNVIIRNLIRNRAFSIINISGLAITLLSFAFSACGQGKLPGFQPDYETAMRVSNEKNQVLMLDFYTDWCKPCKKLDKEVYGSEEFFPYTSQLACVKIDFESEQGVLLGKKYDVSSFPTIVFVKSNGEEIERITSYFPKDRYLSEVVRIIEGKNTVPQMEARFPDVSYAELHHLSYYYSRRFYNQEKTDLYYNELIKLDPNSDKDSTHMVSNLRYYTLLARGDLSRRMETEDYVLTYAKVDYTYELAIKVSKSYIKEEKYQKAYAFFTKFIKASGSKSNKQVKTHLKSLEKLI